MDLQTLDLLLPGATFGVARRHRDPGSSPPGLAGAAGGVRRGPGGAFYADPRKAFAEENGTYDAGAASLIVEWLRKRNTESTTARTKNNAAAEAAAGQ